MSTDGQIILKSHLIGKDFKRILLNPLFTWRKGGKSHLTFYFSI